MIWKRIKEELAKRRPVKITLSLGNAGRIEEAIVEVKETIVVQQ